MDYKNLYDGLFVNQRIDKIYVIVIINNSTEMRLEHLVQQQLYLVVGLVLDFRGLPPGQDNEWIGAMIAFSNIDFSNLG